MGRTRQVTLNQLRTAAQKIHETNPKESTTTTWDVDDINAQRDSYYHTYAPDGMTPEEYGEQVDDWMSTAD